MGTYTTNKELFMPSVGETGWGELVNNNFSTIDTYLKPISLSGSTYTFTGNHVGNQSGGSISATSITNSGTSTFTGKIAANGGIGTKALTATTGTFSGAVTCSSINGVTITSNRFNGFSNNTTVVLSKSAQALPYYYYFRSQGPSTAVTVKLPGSITLNNVEFYLNRASESAGYNLISKIIANGVTLRLQVASGFTVKCNGITYTGNTNISATTANQIISSPCYITGSTTASYASVSISTYWGNTSETHYAYFM